VTHCRSTAGRASKPTTLGGVDRWRDAAVHENAEWCDVVARSHGCETHVDATAWTSATRTPPGYPDAVTLVPALDAPTLLVRIDSSAGCSVKDSFALLDLHAHGFRVLFDATWLVHTDPSPTVTAPDQPWDRVQDAAGLVAWERAWRGDAGSTGLFPAELLDDETVVVAGARRKQGFVAGAILHRADGVVGVSNVFGEAAPAWSGCVAFAASCFPRMPLVGYEHGADLAQARRHDFEPVGPLRVWVRDD
jgi:hypothetical protein